MFKRIFSNFFRGSRLCGVLLALLVGVNDSFAIACVFWLFFMVTDFDLVLGFFLFDLFFDFKNIHVLISNPFFGEVADLKIRIGVSVIQFFEVFDQIFARLLGWFYIG